MQRQAIALPCLVLDGDTIETTKGAWISRHRELFILFVYSLMEHKQPWVPEQSFIATLPQRQIKDDLFVLCLVFVCSYVSNTRKSRGG